MRRTILLVPLVLGSLLPAADEDYSADAQQNQRPMLGIEMTPVETRIQDREGIDAHTGVQVQHTYGGTAAESMGLQPDDVVLKVNGQPISSMTDLRNEVGLTAVGDQVGVTVSRNGKVMDLGAQVKPWPAEIPYQKLDSAAEQRFRDWQDRRQQRLADDVARLDREAERLRRQLAGEDDAAANRRDPADGLGLAFRFTYGIDGSRLPATAAPDVPLPTAVVTGVPPWRLSITMPSSASTTL